jgi:PAS domain S-box-containing protein
VSGEIGEIFELDTMRRALIGMQRRAKGAGTPEAAEAALTALSNAIEELQVAAEELEIKNEELMNALGELSAQHDRYQQLFDLMPDGYVTTDTAGAIVEANAAAGRLLQQAPGDLVGMSLESLLGPEVGRLHGSAAREGDRSLVVTDAAGERNVIDVHFRRETTPARVTRWLLRQAGRQRLDGEDLATTEPATARSWLTVYGELIAVNEDLLDPVNQRLAAASGSTRTELENAREALRTRLERLRHRRSLWRRRHLELTGLGFDRTTGILTDGSKSARLTHREAQLLSFLLDHPGTSFTADALLRRAWVASFLSKEQIRTYVVRVRRKLEASGAPCRLVNVHGHGYRLEFD